MYKSDQNSFKNYNVSVVIPTLGGPSLSRTIEQLNSGTIVPSEILICIPEAHAYKVDNFFCENVKIVKTNFMGQVRQRAFGFTVAVEHFVMQLDDDVYIRPKCLQAMIECIGNKDNISVSPSLLDIKTNKLSAHLAKPSGSSCFLYKFLFWIVNSKDGYQPGKISKAGLNMGYSSEASSSYEVDWLPGGCALHIKKNLVTENYYPYSGKAFAEDLFHSIILSKKGVHLFHCPEAECSLDNSSSKGDSFFSLLKIYFSFSRIMFRFVSFNGNSHIRLVSFLILNYLLLIFDKFKNR